MKIFGRTSTSIDPAATATARAALAAELATLRSASLQPGDPGHPDTPAVLARETIIAKALAQVDEAILATAAESAWR